ncbi:MAG: prolipoprotein diacylglyceryl transferase [Nitrospirae bacterium]|nr:prolipoprotein diacylglyceryl transferase [Nitrospirota bacterium]MBI4838469.1 prolipoprotein diacylglyceryl transferase [Nitrospirota bacterium]
MFPFIHIGSLSISTWRVVVLASLVICWILLLLRAKNLGYPVSKVFIWLMLGLPAATLGGHLFNKLIPFIFETGNTSNSMSGLTIIGSIISGLLYSLLYIKYVMKLSPLHLLDAGAFVFPLSIMLGRMGCLLGGCCYGRAVPESISSSFLSVFTLPVDFYAPPSEAWYAYKDMPHDSHVWNLPLFLMINAFFALIVTETVYRKRKEWGLYPGTVFAAAGALYALGRFPAEFLREEKVVGSTIFNPWQLSIFFLFCMFFIWLCVSIYKRKHGTTS